MPDPVPPNGRTVRDAMEPEWNDLREQRILGRVLEAKRAHPIAPAPRLGVPRLGVGIAAAAAVLVLAGGALLRSRAKPVPVAPVATAQPAAPPKIVLADGSEAILRGDAEVKVEEQQADRVTLVQSVGEVRYHVKPTPERRFAVRVGDVTVRGTDTAFTVSFDAKKVRVHVERGSVVIDAGRRTATLVATESLEVAAFRAEIPPAPVASEAVAAEKPAPKPAPPSVEALLAKADEARAARRDDDAAEALRTLVALHPKDPRVPSALFTLARVERARGRHTAAAQAFQRCHQAAPNGPLAEDARAEEALSWKSAGDASRARTAAEKYLSIHPAGAHVARIRPLTE